VLRSLVVCCQPPVGEKDEGKLLLQFKHPLNLKTMRVIFFGASSLAFGCQPPAGEKDQGERCSSSFKDPLNLRTKEQVDLW
jgi:hypothetical protein